MKLSEQQRETIQRELSVKAVRSSGPGGQNVNKVSTKIELRFNVSLTESFSINEKEILLTKLASKLTLDGELVISAQTSRSQIKNKEEALEKLFQLIEKALTPRKKRLPTKPTLASKQKRLESKKQISEKKIMRKKIE